MRTLTRILIIVPTNAILFYVVSIALFLTISALLGLDPRESGFLIGMSPLAIVILAMVVPAIASGLLSGAFINIFWGFAVGSVRNNVKISILLGAGFSLLPTIWFAILYAQEDNFRVEAVWGTLIVFASVFLVGALSNLLTIALVKTLLPEKQLP